MVQERVRFYFHLKFSRNDDKKGQEEKGEKEDQHMKKGQEGDIEEEDEDFDDEVFEGIERPGEPEKQKQDEDDDDEHGNGGEMMPIPEMF